MSFIVAKGPRAGWDADGNLDLSSPEFIDGTERTYRDEDDRRRKIQNLSRVSSLNLLTKLELTG